MSEFDRMIEESLRRRAEMVPALPKSYGDVSRRIVRRRRRSASFATAAVTLPALVAVGWAVSRPEQIGTSVGAPTFDDPNIATTTTDLGAGQYRCTGQIGTDGAWTYYQYCEMTDFGAQTTLLLPTTAPGITFDLSEAMDHVLFVDASGGLDFRGDLLGRLGTSPRYELPATRTVEQTMMMPTGADVEVAYSLMPWLGIGGFDTWSPDLIDGSLPDGIAAVVVVGADWFSRVGSSACAPATTTTTAPPAPTSTSLLPEGAVTTSSSPPPTTTIFVGC